MVVCEPQGALRCYQRTPPTFYASDEGYDTLQQMDMSLIVAQHPIPRAKRVLKTLHFEMNLRVNLNNNYIVWTIRGL